MLNRNYLKKTVARASASKIFAFLIAIVCINASAFCQYSNLEFVENKGQWNESIRYKGVMNNGAFFLQQHGFRVVLNNQEDMQKMADYYHGAAYRSVRKETVHNTLPAPGKDGGIIRSHAYDVEFLNAGTPVIVPDKPLNTYSNYFIGNNPAKWKGNCRIYQAVTYQNLYPGIDVRYYTNGGRLKYDLLVHPGADLSRLIMKYNGVEGMQVKNEQLVIKTSVGETRELEPFAYQLVDGQKKEVQCRYKVAGTAVQFDIKDYTKTATLVIDPVLVFATFTGSTADNWGYTATYGTDGSFFAGGIVFNTGFPVSAGAFQTTYGGGENDTEGLEGYDIGIIKFSPDGTNRVFATYLGGSQNEYPHSIVADAQGNLVIGGRTTSANFPVTTTNVGKGGKYDIFLAKLNAAGNVLLGSRKIGGSANDGVNINPKYSGGNPLPAESLRRNYGDDSRSEVILDNAGNIILASCTQSSDFPFTTGSLQTVLGGKQDGVVIKASADLSTILFSTFLGGSENDAAFSLALNPLDNNIYVSGNTASANLPGDKTGAYQQAFNGGESDGFVSILKADGTSLIKTSYFGTADNDMLYGIQFDKFGFPYIMGTTTGNWPVINAAFSQAGSRQFIAKVQPDLSNYVYSTVFGTNSPMPNISPVAFLVDRCENVYVSGWGGSIDMDAQYPNSGTSGLSVTSDAIQSTTDNSDFYFFVLERNATKQLYGSFFGQNGGTGEHVDGGTSRFDRNGVVYQAICANCGGGALFPTTPGVWSPTNPSDNCNLAAIKIAFNLAGVAGSVRSSIEGSVNDTTGCVPLAVNFTDTLAEGKKYIWNFGDGTGDFTTATADLSHTFSAIGNYRIRLVSIDSEKCNISDTAYTNIRVRTFEAILDFALRKLEPCQAFNYLFTNTSFVSPAARNFSANSFTWDFGDNTPPVIGGLDTISHSFPAPGNYNVTLSLTDTNFCNAPADTLKILRIATNVSAAFSTSKTGCAPYTAIFDNTSAGGQSFFWDFGDGTIVNTPTPVHLYSSPGSYNVTLIAVDSATCNIVDTSTFTITVSSNPVASFSFTPNPPQENTPVDFFNNSTGANNFLWKFGDGDSLATTSTAELKHTYNETKTFNACLTASNNFGCADTVCQNIAARIIPLLDVPNAFTPNGDGINDKIFVRGFGISKMTWRIYNRWGSLVFETSDRLQGWDGTYNGSIQPKEVYHYVLDVAFSDNTKYQKKGDITLLR